MAEPVGRNLDCARCRVLCEQAEREGRKPTYVAQVEEIRSTTGYVYYAGLCRACSVIEKASRSPNVVGPPKGPQAA